VLVRHGLQELEHRDLADPVLGLAQRPHGVVEAVECLVVQAERELDPGELAEHVGAPLGVLMSSRPPGPLEHAPRGPVVALQRVDGADVLEGVDLGLPVLGLPREVERAVGVGERAVEVLPRHPHAGVEVLERGAAALGARRVERPEPLLHQLLRRGVIALLEHHLRELVDRVGLRLAVTGALRGGDVLLAGGARPREVAHAHGISNRSCQSDATPSQSPVVSRSGMRRRCARGRTRSGPP